MADVVQGAARRRCCVQGEPATFCEATARKTGSEGCGCENEASSCHTLFCREKETAHSPHAPSEGFAPERRRAFVHLVVKDVLKLMAVLTRAKGRVMHARILLFRLPRAVQRGL